MQDPVEKPVEQAKENLARSRSKAQEHWPEKQGQNKSHSLACTGGRACYDIHPDDVPVAVEDNCRSQGTCRVDSCAGELRTCITQSHSLVHLSMTKWPTALGSKGRVGAESRDMTHQQTP